MTLQALDLLNAAYRKHNLLPLTSLNNTQEFPQNIALDVLNDVIAEMNRMGNLWFMEQRTLLAFQANQSQYDLETLGIDPQRIRYIRRQASGFSGELIALNYQLFQRMTRTTGSIAAGMPQYWSKYAGVLELNVSPDRDYQLMVYHYRDLPMVTLQQQTVFIPDADQDVLVENMVSLLGVRIGKWSMQEALQLIFQKTLPLLRTAKNDTALPQQLPANF